MSEELDEIKEALGQMDLYLTYDGHLSSKDIDTILSIMLAHSFTQVQVTIEEVKDV